VQVDTGRPTRHAGEVPPVCTALRLAREEVELTQEELARRVGRVQSSIYKWENGREPKLDRIRDLEQAMGYPRGHVLRLAGYVADSATARDAIRLDPGLTPNQRENLLAAYDVAAAASSRSRTARSASEPPVKATRSRS
jgi:transcriptional regulator with XRE-family HTH domain